MAVPEKHRRQHDFAPAWLKLKAENEQIPSFQRGSDMQNGRARSQSVNNAPLNKPTPLPPPPPKLRQQQQPSGSPPVNKEGGDGGRFRHHSVTDVGSGDRSSFDPESDFPSLSPTVGRALDSSTAGSAWSNPLSSSIKSYGSSHHSGNNNLRLQSLSKSGTTAGIYRAYLPKGIKKLPLARAQSDAGCGGSSSDTSCLMSSSSVPINISKQPKTRSSEVTSCSAENPLLKALQNSERKIERSTAAATDNQESEDEDLSKSMEEEKRLLKEMGWKEEDSEEEDFVPITDDEVNEFKKMLSSRDPVGS